MRKTETTVAGVTFNNNATDGGRNRQDVLKELATTRGTIITVDLKKTTYHNDETNEDESAIKCVEHATKQVIGWIPRANIAAMSHSQMTGFIGHNKHGYYVALDNQQAPSQAQYHAVKDICNRNGFVMPAYDKRAYGAIFAMEREQRKRK